MFAPIVYSDARRVIVAVSIMLVAFITLYNTKMPFITNNFLVEDDLINIPKWQFQGFSYSSQGIPTFSYFLSFLFKYLREPALIRMVLMAVFACSISLVSYVLLYEYSIVAVGCLAILTTLVQMGVDQGILIVGSYPMFGVSITLIAFSLIYSSSKNMANPLLFIIPGYIFATFAQLVHPVFIFVPCSFLILIPNFNKKYALINIIFIAASYIVRILVMSTYIYHYKNLKGWTDYSLDAILLKIRKSIDYILSNINGNGKILLIMIFLLFFGLLINKLTKNDFKQFDRIKILTPIYFLILAILTFGTTAVIRNINARYYYAPQLFFIMALILSAVQLSKNKLQRYSINTMIILLCVSFYINSKEIHKNRFEKIRQMQSNIKRSLSKNYIYSASKNDQIIILMNQLPKHFTYGLNHWSTWFLRYQTGNRHLIGLVGDKKMCGVDPFVDNYKDHSREYWCIKKYNGKDVSYRIRMKGIEYHRNTYAFQETKAGISLIPSLAIPSKDGLFYIAESGKPFESVDTDNPAFLRTLENCYMWDIEDITYNQIKLNSTRIQHTGKYIEFNGHEFLNCRINIKNLPSNLIFRFMLRSVENVSLNSQQHSDTIPPIPLIAGSIFSVYQTNNDSYTFQIGHKKGIKYIEQKIVMNKWQKYKLHFDFINQKLYFYSNDSFLNVIRNIDIDFDISKLQSITIGKGYKKRFWKGDFAYLEVYESKGSEKLTYLKLVPKN